MYRRFIFSSFALVLIIVKCYSQGSNTSGSTYTNEVKFKYTINDPEFRPKIPKLNKSFVEILPGIELSEREISNYDYLLFLKDLEIHNPERYKELQDKFEKQNCWTAYISGMVKGYPLDSKLMDQLYYSHPAYYYYPVTCLNIEEINEYCDWLSSNSNDKIKYRLPSRKEWEVAQGSASIDTSSCIGDHWTYNIKLNDYNICNTNQLPDTSKFYPFYKYFGDGFLFTGPCYSYSKNVAAIYNMTGNVAEIISEGNDFFLIGGSWDSYPQDCSKVMDFFVGPTVGFRVIRERVLKK